MRSRLKETNANAPAPVTPYPVERGGNYRLKASISEPPELLKFTPPSLPVIPTHERCALAIYSASAATPIEVCSAFFTP